LGRPVIMPAAYPKPATYASYLWDTTLGKIAKAQDWRGYFGDPSLSTPQLGEQIYAQWLSQGKELISQVLAGSDYRKLPRYGDLYADDPADAAVKLVNAQLSSQHEAWLKQHAVINESERTTTSEKLKMPGSDVQNLMLGSWSTHVSYEPTPEMPKGGDGTGTEIWRPGPGGLSVIEEYHEKNDKGDVEGLGVAWWDGKAHGQQFVWCENSNPDGCYVSKEVAKWEDANLAWKEEQENAGKNRVYSEVFRDVSPTTFTQVLGEGQPGEPLRTTVTIRATKLPESTMNAPSAETDLR